MRRNLLIVTPTLGTSRHLTQTIDSVAGLARSGMPLTHILISPSASIEGLRSKGLPEGVLLMEESAPAGLYGALNQALRTTPGDWEQFAYINDDDYLLPAFAQLAQASRDVDIGAGRVNYLCETGACFPIPFEPVASRWLPLMAAGIMPFAQPGTIIGRKVFEQLGGFDTSFRAAGDLEFFVRALKLNPRCQVVNEPVAVFRLRPGQLSEGPLPAQEKALVGSMHLQGIKCGAMKRLSFRLRNTPAILLRILATRSLRSSALYHSR